MPARKKARKTKRGPVARAPRSSRKVAPKKAPQAARRRRAGKVSIPKRKAAPKARKPAKNPVRVAAGRKAARTRKAKKRALSLRAKRGWQTRKLRAAGRSTGRQKTKKGRPRNRKTSGKPTKYVPRATTGEPASLLERFDFRGLDDDERASLEASLLRRIDALLRKYDYVAIRVLYAMTPEAAAKRAVSKKAAKNAQFRAGDPFADTRPLIQWTPFERVSSSADAFDYLLELTSEPGEYDTGDDEENYEAAGGVEILAVEVTWHK